MSTLYLFASAAEPVFDIARVIEDAQADGWDVCLGLTPAAARWLAGSLDGLAVLTAHPVRWDAPLPGEPEVWPAASAVLFAPATFAAVNQWALGIADSFVVGFAAEGIGQGIPMVAMPCVSAAHARHPQFERSVEALRGAGVSVLVPDDPAVGFSWPLALSAVRERIAVG
ncbi:flavoprotein [Streptomyces sp. SP18ES09]|uniref:flavoprotein n=1 Tax=Streptomyces sp. SP18ES09 TaxID=3002532 RepID=UPI002E79C540|nr:flavoprotein [Streptomyces sp. SP18ES09]MEE1818320.1 flavoprotein [Streptomyces sp. SP18ES09]